ncbi:MAG: hypothetical protein NT092_04230, partial [Bacteroidia bacterium]|nr:hypothetical protein [Bacteroidia bacterium]
MMRGGFILIIFSLGMLCYSQANTQKAKADSVCLSMINQAEANYNNSLYLDCLDNIEQALSKYEMKRADKTRALELAAKSSVEMGEMGKADSYVNVLIKTFPHYDLIESGNPELYNRLVKKYKIHPLITIGVKNTANWLQHKTTGVYSVLDGLDYSQPQAKAPYWFTYYGMAEYEFIDGLSA